MGGAASIGFALPGFRPHDDHAVGKLIAGVGLLVHDEAVERRKFGLKRELTVTVASLREIGLADGACLEELFRHIRGSRLRPCPPCTGLFLRLAWRDQPQSRNSVLSGTHSAPDLSVTVLSEIPEQSDAFPKGLYLRNVDGKLWLRGYICDAAYRFPGDALFAFEAINE